MILLHDETSFPTCNEDQIKIKIQISEFIFPYL